MVVRGKVELTVGGQTRVLEAGDAYYFSSATPHRFRNVGREVCEIISASTPIPAGSAPLTPPAPAARMRVADRAEPVERLAHERRTP